MGIFLMILVDTKIKPRLPKFFFFYIAATFHKETNSFLKYLRSVCHVQTIMVILEEDVCCLDH